MREVAPLLAEEGIDIDNPEVDDIATLQAALDRAVDGTTWPGSPRSGKRVSTR